MPQLSLGQIPTLDKLNLENSQTTQCLDFNQDKICEYIVLANGTTVKNPDLISTAAPVSATRSTTAPGQTTELRTQTGLTTWTDPNTGLVYDIPIKGPYCLDFDGDYICDVDFVNGKMILYGESAVDQPQTVVEDEEAASGSGGGGGGGDNDVLPYCDVAGYEDGCFDRKDYDQETGLFPCNDGSYEEDWKDCDDVSGGGNNDDEDEEADDNDVEDEEADDNDVEDEEADDDYEVAEGYEDDGYIDENEDGDYDPGEE
jgi:hypothetical protein